MYEHRSEPLLPWPLFRRRAIQHAGVAFLVLFLALLLGMAIYHWTEGLDWIESFLNASMLLGGMGRSTSHARQPARSAQGYTRCSLGSSSSAQWASSARRGSIA